MAYTWRESIEFQLSRVRRHFQADLFEWAERHGAKVSARAYEELEDRVYKFAEDYLDLSAEWRAEQAKRAG